MALPGDGLRTSVIRNDNGVGTLVDEDKIMEKMESIAEGLAEKIRADFPRVEKEITYLESVLPRLG